MSIDDGGVFVHRVTALLVGVGLLVSVSGLLLGGCTDSSPTSQDIRVPVRELIRWQRQMLDSPPMLPGGEDVRRFYTLRQNLRIPARRPAAEQELWSLLEARPDHLLWLEAAIIRRRYLDQPARLDSLIAAHVAADSSGAVARFAVARRDWTRVDGAARGLFEALDAGHELAPVSRVWLELRCALAASRLGRLHEAIDRLAAALPNAWSAGGLPLASCTWYEISRVTGRLGWLDESLEAAQVALECAERAGCGIMRIRGHLIASRAYEARAEYGLAMGQARRAAQLALAGDHQRWLQDAARQFIYLLSIEGNEEASLAQGTELFAMSLDMADTNSALAACVGLATSYATLGDRVATAHWLETAQGLNTAGYWHEYDTRLGLVRWQLALEDGHYAVADSILSRMEAGLNREERLTVLIESMEIGMEHGRPLMVHDALARIRADEKFLVPDGAYDPERDVAPAAALFFARQGDFQQAYDEIDRNAALIAAGAPIQSIWTHAYTRGRIAELEGDDSLAVQSLTEALDLALEMNNRRLAGRSRVRLGEALIRRGQTGEARALFAATLNSPDYWSRLASQLVTGRSLAAESRHQEALERFEAVTSALGAGGPSELRLRVALEAARSLFALARYDEAGQRIEAVDNRRARHGVVRESEIFHAFYRPVQLDLTELKIAILLARSRGPASSQVALQTLAEAEAARWRLDAAREDSLADTLGSFSLQDGSPLLAWFRGPERMFVWTGTTHGWRVEELDDPELVLTKIRNVTVDLSSPESAYDRSSLAELGRLLLGPVLSDWSDGMALHLVAPDVFASVPWPALIIEQPGRSASYSIHRGPIIHLASFANRPATDSASDAPTDLLAVGFDDEGSRRALRSAEDEARFVSTAWTSGQGIALVGEQASWQSVTEAGLERVRVLHIASHAWVRPDVSPQPVLWLDGPDGPRPIDSERVRSLPLQAELVYLSCCEGGRIIQERGSGLDSLARAFLQAGAANVISSNSAVADRWAQSFAQDVYGHWQAGDQLPEALRQAQLARIAQDDDESHPHAWANYQIQVSGIVDR